ncbi:hypothetical protein Dimus_002223 [Dionaea muscipula]
MNKIGMDLGRRCAWQQQQVAVAAAVVCGLVMRAAEGYWCVARSEASEEALQRALDYACGAGGADCGPIQTTGLCYLPNTMLAHASYAFNSYYQRKNSAPGSCDFAGTATLAKTDPSFGSCVYPPNPSTAGAATGSMTPPPPSTPTITTTNPITTPIGGGGGGTLMGTPPPITSNLDKSFQAASLATYLFLQISLLVVTGLLA